MAMNITVMGVVIIVLILGAIVALAFGAGSRSQPRRQRSQSGTSGLGVLLQILGGFCVLLLLGGIVLTASCQSIGTRGVHQADASLRQATQADVVQHSEERPLEVRQSAQLENSTTEDAALEGPPLLNPESGEGHVVGSEETISESQAGAQASHPIPVAVAFRNDMTIWAICGAILITFLIGGGIWIAHYKQHWTMENFRYSVGQCLWVVPILGVVGWVGALYAPYFSLNPLSRDVEYSAAETDFNRYQDDTEVETEGQFQVATQGISPWVTNGKTNHQNKVLVPVHGGWRESQSEAENFARRQALRVLQKDFQSSFPEARNWQIELALNNLSAIPRMETESRNFTLAGNQVEMYRTHLQVELSDTVRAKVVEAWTPRLRTFRTTILQVCMVLLMIVFFAIGGALSLDMRTHGAYSRWIRFASLILVFAAGWGASMMKDALLFRYLV